MCIYEFSCETCPLDGPDPEYCIDCEFRPDDFFDEFLECSD